MGVAAHYCERLGVLYAGQIVEIGPVMDLFTRPKHPYTAALMETVKEKSSAIESPLLGFTPDPRNLPKGCYASEACPYATKECLILPPHLRGVGPDHYIRCHEERL